MRDDSSLRFWIIIIVGLLFIGFLSEIGAWIYIQEGINTWIVKAFTGV